MDHVSVSATSDLIQCLTPDRRAEIEDGIDDEGLIETTTVETRYCPIGYAAEDPARRYLSVVGDDGMTNVEIRIPFELLEQNGWRKEAKS